MLSKVGDAAEAAALSREAATRLGVDATQLWIEAQRLSTSLRKPPAPVGVATSAPAPPVWERDLVALLLASVDARGALLGMVEVGDVNHKALANIVAALKATPGASVANLLADVTDDACRQMISALTIDDYAPIDQEGQPLAVDQLVRQFARRLAVIQSRRRVRETSRSIAEVPASDQAKTEQLATVQTQSARVYEFSGGKAQELRRSPSSSDPKGPEGPQGVQTHE